MYVANLGVIDQNGFPMTCASVPRVQKNVPPIELNSPSCQPASMHSSIAATKARFKSGHDVYSVVRSAASCIKLAHRASSGL